MKTELEMITELQQQVADLEGALNTWKAVGMPEETIVILLQHHTKLPKRDIKKVMQGIGELFDVYFTDGNK